MFEIKIPVYDTFSALFYHSLLNTLCILFTYAGLRFEHDSSKVEVKYYCYRYTFLISNNSIFSTKKSMVIDTISRPADEGRSLHDAFSAFSRSYATIYSTKNTTFCIKCYKCI